MIIAIAMLAWQYLEVGVDHLGPPDLQLPSGLAIPGQLMAIGAYDAHMTQDVWPSLTLLAA